MKQLTDQHEHQPPLRLTVIPWGIDYIFKVHNSYTSGNAECSDRWTVEVMDRQRAVEFYRELGRILWPGSQKLPVEHTIAPSRKSLNLLRTLKCLIWWVDRR